MTMRATPRAALFLLLLGALLAGGVATGCSRSPEAKKARHLERGDRYFGREQYREALIEYRNVLRLEPLHPRAIQQIGLAHYELGEPNQAFRFLLKAQELNPDNTNVHLRLGSLYVIGRQGEQAEHQATLVLAREPQNVEALALLASSADSPAEVDSALRRLEAVRSQVGDRPRLLIPLATLYLRKQDVTRAEQVLDAALASEPKSVDVHLARGGLYVAKRDTARAEQAFRAAAELAPEKSAPYRRLADFYLAMRQPEEARRVLIGAIEKAPDALALRRRLAEIELGPAAPTRP